MTAFSEPTLTPAEAQRRRGWTIKTHSSSLPSFQSPIAYAYDPIAGRWTQRDPIDYQDSINLYQFCGNNPVNATDPDGRFPWIGACAVGFLICHIIYTKTASPISTSHVPEGHGRTVIGIGFYNPKNSPVGVSAANIKQ